MHSWLRARRNVLCAQQTSRADSLLYGTRAGERAALCLFKHFDFLVMRSHISWGGSCLEVWILLRNQREIVNNNADDRLTVRANHIPNLVWCAKKVWNIVIYDYSFLITVLLQLILTLWWQNKNILICDTFNIQSIKEIPKILMGGKCFGGIILLFENHSGVFLV